VLQSLGRGLRKTDTKSHVLIFDIADDISYNSKRNFTLNHFSERISLYNEQQFDYQISKVKL
jgi:superfamily II DNA or RNA helicase